MFGYKSQTCSMQLNKVYFSRITACFRKSFLDAFLLCNPRRSMERCTATVGVDGGPQYLHTDQIWPRNGREVLPKSKCDRCLLVPLREVSKQQPQHLHPLKIHSRPHQMVCNSFLGTLRRGLYTYPIGKGYCTSASGILLDQRNTDLAFIWHPPTMAPSHSPLWIAWRAKCIAVNDELHAVST